MDTGIVVLFLAASAGATTIVTCGRVFNAIRPAWNFFHCAMCMGFWVGAVMLWVFKLAGLVSCPNVAFTFVAACASSVTSYVVALVIRDNGIAINK